MPFFFLSHLFLKSNTLHLNYFPTAQNTILEDYGGAKKQIEGARRKYQSYHIGGRPVAKLKDK